MALKLAAVLAAIAPFLATDKKPEEVKAAILAADKAGAKDKGAKDKGAKDKAKDGMPGNVGEAKEIEGKDEKDPDAKDEKEDDMDAKDRDDDPEHTNDEKDPDVEDEDYSKAGDPSTPGGNRAGGKTTVDSAEVDRRISAAVAARDSLHEALREVEPVIGRVTFDSAPKAYRAALKHLGIDTAGIHSSALPSMLKLAKDKAAASTPAIALDSSAVSALDKVIPGYSRLR